MEDLNEVNHHLKRRKVQHMSNLQFTRPACSDMYDSKEDTFHNPDIDHHYKTKEFFVSTDQLPGDVIPIIDSKNRMKGTHNRVSADSDHWEMPIGRVTSVNSYGRSNIASSTLTANNSRSSSDSTPINKELRVGKNSSFLPVRTMLKPCSALSHKVQNKNVRNLYDIKSESLPLSNYQSGYDSDASEDQEVYNTSNYVHPQTNNYSSPASSISLESKHRSSVHGLPIHPHVHKKSYHSDCNDGCTGSRKSDVYSPFQCSLRRDLSNIHHMESLTMKHRQLAEKKEQFRLAEELVKQQEQEAQIKIWETLKEEAAALKEKEESLKYRERMAQKKYEEAIRRERMAQKKYEEAIRLLGEINKPLEPRRIQVAQPALIRSNQIHETPLVSARGSIEHLTKQENHFVSSPMLYSYPEARPLSLETQKSSDTSAESKNDFVMVKGPKHVTKVSGRPRKSIYPLSISEVKTSIEPSKILRTYSRKCISRERSQSVSSSYNVCTSLPCSKPESVPLSTEVQAIDMPASTNSVKEQIVINETGSITITPLPRLGQPQKHCRKCKSENFNSSAPSVPLSIRKFPSRIESDSSPYSSSSDLSGSFMDKVKKLTPATNLEDSNTSTLKNGKYTSIGSAVGMSEVRDINLIVGEQPTSSVIRDQSPKFSVKNESLIVNSESNAPGDRQKRKLSMVTLKSISYPSQADITNEYIGQKLERGNVHVSDVESNEHYANLRVNEVIKNLKSDHPESDSGLLSQMFEEESLLQKENSSKMESKNTLSHHFKEFPSHQLIQEFDSADKAPDIQEVLRTEECKGTSPLHINLVEKQTLIHPSQWEAYWKSDSQINENEFENTDTELCTVEKERKFSVSSQPQHSPQSNNFSKDIISENNTVFLDDPKSTIHTHINTIRSPINSASPVPENLEKNVQFYTSQSSNIDQFSEETINSCKDFSREPGTCEVFERDYIKNNSLLENSSKTELIPQPVSSANLCMKIYHENLQPVSNVMKIHAAEECTASNTVPVENRLSVTNEGHQITNVQNIVFDVKNINQSSLAMFPNSNFPGNRIIDESPSVIQCDQKLLQCILNNSDQSVFYTPTVVYTSPPQNLLHSYATNTIPSCSSMTLVEQVPYTLPESGEDMQDDLNPPCSETSEYGITTTLDSHLENFEVKGMGESHSTISRNSFYPIQDKSIEGIEQFELKESHFKRSPVKESFTEDHFSATEVDDSVEDSFHDESNDLSSICDTCPTDLKRERLSEETRTFNELESLDSAVEAPSKLRDLNLTDKSSVISEKIESKGVDSDFVKEEADHVRSSRGGRILKLKEWWPTLKIESSKKCVKVAKSTCPVQELPVPLSTQKTKMKTLPVKKKMRRPKQKGEDNILDSLPVKKKGGRSNKKGEDNIFDWNNIILSSNERISYDCGKCNKEFATKEQFKDHAFNIHSGLVRLKGESQDFDDVLAFKIYSHVFNELKILYCDACEKHFKTILGFKYHRETCKVLNHNVFLICKLCGDEVMKLLMKKHLDQHEKLLLKGASDSEDDTLDDTSGRKRKRRKAALSCHDQMKLLYDDIDPDVDDTKDTDFESESVIQRLFEKNMNQSFTIPSDIVQTFAENIQKFGKSSCTNSSCEASFSSVVKFKLHLKSCLKSKQELTCKMCHVVLKGNEVMEHVQKHHPETLEDPLEIEDETALDEVEVSNVTHSPTQRSEDKPPSYKAFCPAFQWTHQFRKKNYSNLLYPELLCQQSEWIPIIDFKAYLHNSEVTFSPLFKVLKVRSHKNSPQNWEKLEIFSGKEDGEGEIFFAGGPIRAAAWCPLPVTGKNVDQYIALESVSNPDELFLANRSTKHKGLIQLWNCGSLVGETQTPTIALCIAHEYGIAWCLEWCPSGIYEPVLENENIQSSNIKRLGYLSAAFSDGTIRLFLIPHPHQILSESRVFKKAPDLSLLPYSEEEMDIQCLKVSWCSSQGHSLMAGSFTNGMVCIWNLTSSPLLKTKDENGHSILYPVNTIQAHIGVCSTVSFCPQTKGRNIVTGGNDRIVKFWDLTQPEHPLSMFKKGVVTDSVWLPYWAGAFTSYDDAFNLSKTSTTFRECGFYGTTTRPIVGTNAAVWSISGSDWLNAIAQVDEAGEVLVACQQSLECEVSGDKFSSKKRYPIFSVQLESLKDGQILSLEKEYHSRSIIPVKNQQDKSPKMYSTYTNFKNMEENPEEFREQPTSFTQAIEVYGLRINDGEYKNLKNIKEKDIRSKQFSELMEPGPLTLFPLMGASSVAWNNNRGTHTWIFVGLNSGLGRVVRLSFLNDKKK